MTNRVIQDAVFAGALSQPVILDVGDVRIVGALPVSYGDAEEMNAAVHRFVESVGPSVYRKVAEQPREGLYPVFYKLD